MNVNLFQLSCAANNCTFTRLTCKSSCFPHRLANKSTLPKNGVPYTKRIFKHFTIKDRHCIPRSNKYLQRLFFCEMSVRRSKNCLEFSNFSEGRLKISRRPFHSCTSFEDCLTNSLRFTVGCQRRKMAQDGEWRVKRVESLTVQNFRVT